MNVGFILNKIVTFRYLKLWMPLSTQVKLICVDIFSMKNEKFKIMSLIVKT